MLATIPVQLPSIKTSADFPLNPLESSSVGKNDRFQCNRHFY